MPNTLAVALAVILWFEFLAASPEANADVD
jgi:hypothetical protein